MAIGYFRVDGADLETGEESYLILQASGVQEAELVARKQGMLVAAVRVATPADWGATDSSRTAPAQAVERVITFEPVAEEVSGQFQSQVAAEGASASPPFTVITGPVADVETIAEIPDISVDGGSELHIGEIDLIATPHIASIEFPEPFGTDLPLPPLIEVAEPAQVPTESANMPAQEAELPSTSRAPDDAEPMPPSQTNGQYHSGPAEEATLPGTPIPPEIPPNQTPSGPLAPSASVFADAVLSPEIASWLASKPPTDGRQPAIATTSDITAPQAEPQSSPSATVTESGQPTPQSTEPVPQQSSTVSTASGELVPTHPRAQPPESRGTRTTILSYLRRVDGSARKSPARDSKSAKRPSIAPPVAPAWPDPAALEPSPIQQEIASPATTPVPEIAMEPDTIQPSPIVAEVELASPPAEIATPEVPQAENAPAESAPVEPSAAQVRAEPVAIAESLPEPEISEPVHEPAAPFFPEVFLEPVEVSLPPATNEPALVIEPAENMTNPHPVETTPPEAPPAIETTRADLSKEPLPQPITAPDLSKPKPSFTSMDKPVPRKADRPPITASKSQVKGSSPGKSLPSPKTRRASVGPKPSLSAPVPALLGEISDADVDQIFAKAATKSEPAAPADDDINQAPLPTEALAEIAQASPLRRGKAGRPRSAGASNFRIMPFLAASLATLTTLGGLTVMLSCLLIPAPPRATETAMLDYHVRALTQTVIGATTLLAGLLSWILLAMVRLFVPLAKKDSEPAKRY